MNNRNHDIQNKRKGPKYTLLTFVLLLCIVELIISNVQNINKFIHFQSKIKGLEIKRDEELSKNKDLKSEIENFNSETTLESIARNNLKMAGKDEVLILINEQEKEDIESDSLQENKSEKTKRIKR